jgi:hypothetical protein
MKKRSLFWAMRSPRSRTYSCFMANVTDEDRSGTMFYGGYDHQVGKERAVEMRWEVEQNAWRPAWRRVPWCTAKTFPAGV